VPGVVGLVVVAGGRVVAGELVAGGRVVVAGAVGRGAVLVPGTGLAAAPVEVAPLAAALSYRSMMSLVTSMVLEANITGV
jgi:hypothetical protein